MNARPADLSPSREKVPKGRERVGKKQRMPTQHRQKRAGNFVTFFYAFVRLRPLQEAEMLLAWHACLGPAPLLSLSALLPRRSTPQRTHRTHEEAARGAKAHLLHPLSTCNRSKPCEKATHQKK
jgi:hypothetical protein